MAKDIAKKSIVFDFDDIQQKFDLDGTYNPPKESLNTSKSPKSRLKNPRKHIVNRAARKVVKGLPKCLGLPQICNTPNRSMKMIVRQESPWDTYRRMGMCEVAGEVIVAVDRSRSSRMRTFRKYGRADADKLIHHFRNIDHLNVLTTQECYIDQFSMYALVDHLPLTLNDLVCCYTVYPTERELALIISQVCFCQIRNFSIS